MTKKMTLIFLAIIIFITAGCGVMTLPPSGVSPGMAYSSVNYPSMQNSITEYKFGKDDIEVLGPVLAETSSINILGLFSTGDNGYGKLLEEARRRFPEADGLVNVYFDSRYTSCLWGMIFSKVNSTVTATAVKFKK